MSDLVYVFVSVFIFVSFFDFFDFDNRAFNNDFRDCNVRLINTTGNWVWEFEFESTMSTILKCCLRLMLASYSSWSTSRSVSTKSLIFGIILQHSRHGIMTVGKNIRARPRTVFCDLYFTDWQHRVSKNRFYRFPWCLIRGWTCIYRQHYRRCVISWPYHSGFWLGLLRVLISWPT